MQSRIRLAIRVYEGVNCSRFVSVHHSRVLFNVLDSKGENRRAVQQAG